VIEGKTIQTIRKAVRGSGLTVKSRLQVLVPGTPSNYYTEFQIIPPGLEDKLRQGQTCRVLICSSVQVLIAP